MILTCDTVETFYRHTLHGNPGFASQTAEAYSKVAVKVFLYEKFVDSASCLDSFEGGMNAKDIIVAVHSV